MARAVVGLLEALEDADSDVRQDAVKTFARAAVRGDAAAVELVTQRVEDSDEDVRLQALRSLPQVARPGDACAIRSAVRRISTPDADAHVRAAAADVLVELEAAHDREAHFALARCGLRDEDGNARRSALAALRDLVAEGDAPATEDAMRFLEEDAAEEALPPAALGALLKFLAHVACRGDLKALEAAVARLSHPSDVVRWAAVLAVGELAPKRDARASSALIGCLDDEDDDVRCEALEALAVLSSGSSVSAGGPDSPPLCGVEGAAAAGVAATACSLLVDPAGGIPAESVVAAAAAAGSRGQGAAGVEAAACRLLGDPADDVRAAAVTALAAVVRRGSPASLARARELLDSDSAELRRTALQALRLCAEPSSEAAAAWLLECFEDADEDVRRDAVSIAPGLACGGDGSRKLLEASGRLLREDSDEDVRAAAATSVAALVPAGDSTAMSMMLSALEDPEATVRCAAAKGLSSVAKPGSAEALSAIVACLGDEDSVVREAAVHATAALAEGSLDDAWRSLSPSLAATGARTRSAAAEAAAAVLTSEDERLHEVAALLSDVDDAVREAVGDALAQVRGDPCLTLRAIQAQHDKDSPATCIAILEATSKIAGHLTGEQIGSAMLRGLESAHKEVRDVAVERVGGLRESVDDARSERVLAALAVRIEGCARASQRAIVAALGGLAPKGDPYLHWQAARLLESLEPQNRRVGVELLAATGEPSDGHCVTAVAEALTDSDERVRDAAVQALGALVAAGRPPHSDRYLLPCPARDAALEGLAPHLKHACEAVRCSAAEAVAAVASRGDADATPLLLPLLADVDADVRWVTLNSLRQVAARGDACALAGVKPCMRDADEQVRIAAIDTSRHLAIPGDVDMMAVLRERLKDTPDVAKAALRALVDLFTAERAAEMMEEAGLSAAEPAEAQ